MSMMDDIAESTVVEEFALGPYQALLHTDIDDSSIHRTRHLLEIRDGDEPIMTMAAQIHAIHSLNRENGPYLLAMRYQGRYWDLGEVEDWSDLEVFREGAINIARQSLDLDGSGAPILRYMGSCKE